MSNTQLISIFLIILFILVITKSNTVIILSCLLIIYKISSNKDILKSEKSEKIDEPEDKLDNSDLVSEYIENFTPNDNSFLYTDFIGEKIENDYSNNLDDKITKKLNHLGTMNKRAIDGAVRTTKRDFEKFYKEELDNQENRDWWSAENTAIEDDYTAYY